jgi:hypothetical protein
MRHRATERVALLVALHDADGGTSVAHRFTRLSASRTSDITDAYVVICARRAGTAVVTSDPDVLRRLDPQLEIVPL